MTRLGEALKDKLLDDGSDRINLYCSRAALGMIVVMVVLVLAVVR